MWEFGKIRSTSGKSSTNRAEIFPKYLLYYFHEIARKYRRKKYSSSFYDSVGTPTGLGPCRQSWQLCSSGHSSWLPESQRTPEPLSLTWWHGPCPSATAWIAALFLAYARIRRNCPQWWFGPQRLPRLPQTRPEPEMSAHASAVWSSGLLVIRPSCWCRIQLIVPAETPWAEARVIRRSA